ncbi:MAG: hypothetical protein PHY43_05390 [Verrucomicrobiales bacterium]|nr:hypothetical protein [Verrucomicrobiales bacterium]
MSIVPKAFFWFMILVMLVSFVVCGQGIAKLHDSGAWSWYFDPNLQNHQSSGFPNLTLTTVRCLNHIVGKILCGILIATASFGCHKLAFKHDCLYSGLFLMMAFAGWLTWVAVWLRFIQPFTPMIRM